MTTTLPFAHRLLPIVLSSIIVACSASTDDAEGDSNNNTPASQATSNGNDDKSNGTPPGTPEPSTEEDPSTSAADRFVDSSCNGAAPVCTAAPAGFGEGDGLKPVDRCAFALDESGSFGTTPPAIVTALEKITTRVSVADVFNDGNRTATKTTSVPGSPSAVGYAFRWQDDDNNSTAWTPQGITGTADADPSGKVEGKSGVLVSFYDHPEGSEFNKGVRIAFVDTTNPAAPKYRFALLVMPKGTEQAPTFDPIRIHAGGIAWVNNFLYVADTSHGFRVFDMRHIMRVATDADTFGCNATQCRAGEYKYVIPQVGKYEIASACKSLFSFVSLDRSSNPPALVSGEYCSTTACSGPLAGRVYRWPLDLQTGLLRSKKTYPTEVLLMSHKQVQGAASIDNTYYLSSSAPAAAGGELYRVAGSKSATSNWSDSPEDLMVDKGNSWLWSLSEAPAGRAVYAVKTASYPKP